MDKNRLIKGRQNGTVSFDNLGFDENDEPKGINDYLNDEEDDDYSNNDNDKGTDSGSIVATHEEDQFSGSEDSRHHDFDDEAVDDPNQVWDVFEETAWENLAHADRKFWARVNFVSRIALCIFLFLFVTGCSCLTSICFFIIVQNINFNISGRLPSEAASAKVQWRSGTDSFVHVEWVWSAIIMITAPYVFTLFSCVAKMCVKKTRPLLIKPLLMALFVETVHSVGLGMFVYVVATNYDPLVVLLLSQGGTVIPSMLRVYRVKRDPDSNIESLRMNMLNLLVFLANLGHLAVVTVLIVYGLFSDDQEKISLVVITPVALTMVSIECWENFVSVKDEWKRGRRQEIRKMKKLSKMRLLGKKVPFTESDKFETGSFLFRAKYAIRDRKTKVDAVCAVWKIFLNFIIPLVLFGSKNKDNNCASILFFTASGSSRDCSLLFDMNLISTTGWCYETLPYLVALVGLVASGAGFKAGKVACKINAQRLCFALPLLLSVPLTFVCVFCSYRYPMILFDCRLLWPKFLEGSLLEILSLYTSTFYLPIIFLGILVVGMTTIHVWNPSAERVASTEKLFVRQLYCGIFFAQSLLLNRAVDDSDVHGLTLTTASSKSDENWTGRIEKITAEEFDEKVEEEMKNAAFPRIYACATMWHESAQEMTQLLKSLFRMDKHQFTLACMWRRFNIVDKDFFNYEAHIFFDDAFTRKEAPTDIGVKTGQGEQQYIYAVNSYVEQLVACVEEASNSVYPPNVAIAPPTKMMTPYGGRLTYTLPGGNLMVVHLKNKYLIRHKKRWSQIMYMYYLLSYKLLLGEDKSSHKKKLADNTFLLALDGDVDFYPDAVQLLVDRMKRDLHVGAACGRIHPIGSGIMVWYQKFEYAVSHWLQKATEHVFGCVLCSPGCFSLFRGSALMEDNVLKRYTTVAQTGRQAVQCDMGEDRWLCTLLLEQGKRVEYAAAADALTFCPDDFGEFFKQRRRWTPSTMANILDLLSDWRHVTKVNSSISLLFIGYQLFLFVSSLLTPGTIFLLVLGAINTAYPSLPLYGAMLMNFIPIVIFVIMCFTASDKIQIGYATILSVMYSLVMMVVLVGLLRQIAESGMCSITAIFFMGVAGIFLLAAILHPQEFTNVLFGLLYFLSIPATSMLMVFYAVANLNVVTWGTRESSTSGGNKGKTTLAARLGLHHLTDKMGGKKNGNLDQENLSSDYTMSFGNLCRCICCPTKQTNEDLMERLGDVENALHELRLTISDSHDQTPLRNEDLADVEDRYTEHSNLMENIPFEIGDRDTSNPLFKDDDHTAKDDKPIEPRDSTEEWYENVKLEHGTVVQLENKENKFWNELIEKYLKPLQEKPEELKKMAEDLTRLRNKAAMLFFLVNALFVTVLFILESVAEYTPGLTIELPCDQGHQGSKIEPISMAFTVIFGILLVLQTFGMLFHRFSTFIHIVASTSLRKRKGNTEQENFGLYKSENFYDLTSDMMLHVGNTLPNFDRLSDVTSVTDFGDRSLSQNTIEGSNVDNIVSKAIQRQRTRGRSMKRDKLIDVIDDRIVPMMKELSMVREKSDEVKGDKEEEGKEESPSERKANPLPKSFPWLKGKSLQAVLSLQQDPERAAMAQKRAEKARERWKTAALRVSRAPQTAQKEETLFSNVVRTAMKNKHLLPAAINQSAEKGATSAEITSEGKVKSPIQVLPAELSRTTKRSKWTKAYIATQVRPQPIPPADQGHVAVDIHDSKEETQTKEVIPQTGSDSTPLAGPAPEVMILETEISETQF